MIKVEISKILFHPLFWSGISIKAPMLVEISKKNLARALIRELGFTSVLTNKFSH